MTVGLPGTGIGGMFYLLSAFGMPLREAYRRMRRRTEPRRWRLALEVAALAAGIVAGLWLTGWLLELGVNEIGRLAPASVRSVARTYHGNLLRTAALALSLGTLGFVLLVVELLRLWVSRASRQTTTPPLPQPDVASDLPPRVASGGRRSGSHGRVLLALLAVFGADARTGLAQVATRAPAHVAPADSGVSVKTHLTRADSAFAVEQRGLAAREYSVVLAADPRNSHATFRLAQLLRRDPAQALRLFQHYVTLEPRDPWGYMALGDALARSGNYDEALRAYATALRLAPGERDAVVGRARVLARAGRTDAALAAYEQWIATHPTDAEAWKELGRERMRAGRPGDAAQALEQAQALAPDGAAARRLALVRSIAAPAITPLVGGSRDSDGNRTTTLGGSIDLAAMGAARLGMSADREQVQDGLTTTGVDHLLLRTTWQPMAVLKFDVVGGATRMDPAGALPAATFPTGQLRARWRAPESGPALDFRAQRSMLEGTPLLVANRVSRAEVGALVDLPLSHVLRLRGLGRTAEISDSSEVNHRTTFAGIVACAVKPGIEVSGQFHATRYAHASNAGYFAPALVQIVELGSYLELETARGMLLAFDVGAGMQHVAEQGAPLGPWGPALRLYSLIVIPVATGREVRLEADAENSPVASEVATTGTWRYGAATLSFRWALP